MLSYFKRALYIHNFKSRNDEKNFKKEVDLFRNELRERRAPASNETRPFENLFIQLEGLGTRNQLQDLDDLDIIEADYSKMLNIKNSFRKNLDIQLDLFEELNGENLVHLEEKRNFGNSGDSKKADKCNNNNHRGGEKKFYFKANKVPVTIYEMLQEGKATVIDGLDLKSELTEKNYVERFQNLLWLEEARKVVDMRAYDMTGIKLIPQRDRFEMTVPGLAEGRPSLVPGDKLILISDKRPKGYEGYIQEVQSERIKFRLNDNILRGCYEDLSFNVYFVTSRTSEMRCHHGVSLFNTRHLIQGIIFPKKRRFHRGIYEALKAAYINVTEGSPSKLKCFYRNLNDQQRQAVLNILKGTCRPMPYIIYGPPGTGKTVTIIESIMQSFTRKPKCKILVCVNTNSGVNIIAKRLIEDNLIPHSANQIIRFAGILNKNKNPEPVLEKFTYYYDTITEKIVKGARIILTTLTQAGALYGYKYKADFLYIDEAGHATEPETLIPVGLLREEGLLVLAGDFHQLGPVCFSNVAKECGLQQSLLKRLSERSIYQRKEHPKSKELQYHEKYITKLLVSNRSDQRLLKVNNELFYDNELSSEVISPIEFLNLFGVKSPLLLKAVKGRETQDFRSPSWFNPHEVVSCVKFVFKLYRAGLKPEQVGVITPYKLQVERLKLFFKRCQLNPCKIASMEEFQGDEREVIIISTVRTGAKNFTVDEKFKLGFLFNEKRFNVATSRAKYMNILVGDPDILKLDPCWLKYVENAEIVM